MKIALKSHPSEVKPASMIKCRTKNPIVPALGEENDAARATATAGSCYPATNDDSHYSEAMEWQA